jgi:hypothetical protein
MKYPGHTYGGFVSTISEWGMTAERREEGRREVRWRVARLSLYIGAKGWRQSVIKTEKRSVINGGGNSYI